MMRRASLAAVGAIGALALGVVAAAGTPKSPTTIVQRANWSDTPSTIFFAGKEHSPKAACIAGRKVEVVLRYTDGSRQLLDTDTTSKHGAWAGGGRLNSMVNIDSGHAKVLRKRIGPRHHRHICKAASTPLTFDG